MRAGYGLIAKISAYHRRGVPRVQNVALKGLGPDLPLIEFDDGIVFGKPVRIGANGDGRGANDVPDDALARSALVRWGRQ